MAGNIGLTENQTEEYEEFKKRKNGDGKPLTTKMEATLAAYEYKLANPELPQGAKTYCKKWLKEYLYKRRDQINSKYLRKGNLTEEQGFTLMAVQLKLGMVYKNEQYRESEYSTGTWDLLKNEIVYDNKSSYSLDTFPMFELVNPKPEYEWQMRVYMPLAKVKKSVLAYTLNDAPEIEIQRELKWIEDPNERANKLVNMIFTKEYFEGMKSKYAPDGLCDFVPIPEEKRIKTFEFFDDNSVTYRIKERVKMCNQYINSLI